MAVQELKLGVPSEKQKLFLTDKHRYVGFGGARGGGKSWAIRTKMIGMAYAHAGIKQVVVRRTYPELRENHIIPLCETLHVHDPDPRKRLAKYNDSKKDITFPNGSRIIFKYCSNASDVETFQGLETDLLYIDEATLIPEESIKKLNAIVRGANEFPKRTYYTCNPNGVGLQWFKRLFIDRKFKDGETPDDYNFIRSLVYDNDALMKSNPDYVRELEALPPKVRDAWLYGNFSAFEGQVFEEWVDDPKHYIDRKWTHVIQPFQIPDDWRIYRGFDFGYSRPFSVGYFGVDHSGIIYHIQELYGCTQTANEGVRYEPKRIAEAIKEVEETDINLKGKQIIGIADPAIFDEQRGESIAQMMEREGVYHEPADHTRLSGLMQCHYRLSFNDRGIPMFYVFTNCKNFIRTVPLLVYDEKKPEDVDTSQEDHAYDMWRYVMMENPINPPIRQKVVKDVREDPLDLWKDNYTDHIGRYDYISF